MKVGFIGLGTMGAFMAANLQKSQYKLVVNDVRRDAAARHLDAGAEWGATPREVAEACDVVFTSLPGPKEVEAVVFGPDGLLAGARPGLAYFDLSTNSQALMRRIHAAFAEKGAQAFDAPVSGGPKGAETGKLAIWVGGDRATYEAHRKVLDAMGDQAAYVGEIGQATVAKLVHNMAGYAIQTALAEVFSMGVKAGLDPLDLWKTVRQGALGRRRTFDRLAEQFLTGRYDPPAFALRLAHKDVTLATSLGRELGVPMRFCQLTLEEMNEALGRGLGNLDSRVPMRLQTERAGVEIACDPAAVQAVLDADRG
ncbi:NAD(P)-dependent oxidoreductase [Paracraurococcus ruber]|uniref:3-hydroxyisobutyrate dehydrogenase n=1 Tax=Paracraurococcus ruber TaxID=77675 RepID=A0ABS1D0A0_9PROT|nr:NAD(P)-dependent oxidoreductase [Paracraurococcus ruber]MBK1660225.1 3-hydroxyisobutyrate dehydrogenase [Paracraurococcus ruber]TDG29680.1 NAD(P)-dependent oxidoreductase [Paracraurococcus ruber]